MTTQILALPKLTLAASVETNEDWLSQVAFVDAGSSPIALDGIAFATKVRHVADDATVWISASTGTGDLVTATSSNVLKWNVLSPRMNRVAPGDYVFDVVATADGHNRTVVTGTLTVSRGITR